MFKAGQDSNRLSLQRGRAVWFLLQDSSGVRWVSVADSLEIDSWALSQAEQCWTTWAVIQGTNGPGVEAADVVYPSVKWVCLRVWFFGWRPRPPCHQGCWMVLSTCRLKSKHLGTHQMIKTSEISKKMCACFCFLFLVFFIEIVLVPAVISFPSLSRISHKAIHQD